MSDLTKVPLVIAIDNMRRYREQMSSMSINAPFAFLIKHDDLTEVLGITETGIMHFERFRVYFGLTADTQWKSYLVPVKKMPNQPDNGIDDIPSEIGFGEYVYDFDAPCPMTCDLNSQLYTLDI